MDLNEVNLLGRVTKDTEVKSEKKGRILAVNSIATGEKYKNSDGDLVESTQFTNLIFWGKIWEIARDYLKKGTQCYIKWKLKTREWENEAWEKRYSTSVIVKDLILLGSPKKKDGASNDEFKESDKKHGINTGDDISVDDLPF